MWSRQSSSMPQRVKTFYARNHPRPFADLRPEKSTRRIRSKALAVQAGATKALQQLLEPLAGFAFDCGLSVNAVNLLLRVAAVRSAARQQYENGQPKNISGIAAMTGVSRGEVSRILKEDFVCADQMSDRHLNPANKILKAWHCDHKFLTAQGRPAELKLYGRGSTFESLVNQYGRGIPVRAIFDELQRIGAIEQTSLPGIYPRMSVPVDRRITPKMIRELKRAATHLSAVVSKATRLGVAEPRKERTVRRRNFRRAD
jgi:Family of unknown function (DUF6502)